MELCVPVWSRKRLRRATGAPHVRTANGGRAEETILSTDRPELDYAFSRDELQPFLQTLRTALGCGSVPLDSPARLQDALGTLVRSLGGEADISVRRSPAALLTPEYWRIRVTGLDQPTHGALAVLLESGRA